MPPTLSRGRRPGTLRDHTETLELQQSFDVIHILGPSVEPQDVPAPVRHYAMMQAQITRADKPMFVFARGRAQIADSLHMIRLGLDLSDDDWANGVWAYTVINTNSPRQLDIPMAQGIIDFARAGQASIITPFCLAGAMAPVTVAGALILQHAEALAGITLAQLARTGAPVSYGGFSSNVDMKSGAPAFGTPEHLKMQIGSGQLARHIGMPWRSASGSASQHHRHAGGAGNHPYPVGRHDGAGHPRHPCRRLAGRRAVLWLREIHQRCRGAANPGRALRPPRCRTWPTSPSMRWPRCPPAATSSPPPTRWSVTTAPFIAPLVADLSNHGQWTEAGALRSDQRATAIWQRILADFQPPAHGAAATDRLAQFIADRTAAGGAAPLD